MSLSTNARTDADAPSVVAASAVDKTPPVGDNRPFWMLAVAALVLGMVWPGDRSSLVDMSVELVMIVLLFMAVGRTTVFKRWWQDMPRSARRSGKFVVVALVAAQFFSISVNAFPLTQWTMYTRPAGELAVAYELVGYTATGDEVDFVPSMTNRTMSNKMAVGSVRGMSEELVAARLDPSDQHRIDQAGQALEQVIDVLVDLHHQRSPDPAVVEVVIMRTTFTPEQRPTGEGETEALWTQQIGPQELGTS